MKRCTRDSQYRGAYHSTGISAGAFDPWWRHQPVGAGRRESDDGNGDQANRVYKYRAFIHHTLDMLVEDRSISQTEVIIHFSSKLTPTVPSRTEVGEHGAPYRDLPPR